jgi:hypothetical protein
MPAILSPRKQKNIIKWCIRGMNIRDAEHRGIGGDTIAENYIPTITRGAIAGKHHSDFLCGR